MGNKKSKDVIWLSDVERHDYASAESYLTLLFPADQARDMVSRLRKAKVGPYKAKDIFRASRLPLLAATNSHVKKDRARMRRGEGLSPLLLVRVRRGSRAEIADGYHRLCAVYMSNEDAMIHCKII
jgi:hypothetical protein